jgi:hypothetical protein
MRWQPVAKVSPFQVQFSLSLASGRMAKAKAPAPVFVGNDAEELGSVGPRGRGIALEQMFVRSYPRDATPPERVRFFHDDKSSCLPPPSRFDTNLIACFVFNGFVMAFGAQVVASFIFSSFLCVCAGGEARRDAVCARHRARHYRVRARACGARQDAIHHRGAGHGHAQRGPLPDRAVASRCSRCCARGGWHCRWQRGLLRDGVLRDGRAHARQR